MSEGLEGFIAVPAPAKLNLFLHIVGRRSDGYHELQTIFQFLDYSDTVYLRTRSDGAIARSGGIESVPLAQDLTLRAARSLAGASAQPVPGVDIRVQKRIPIGGGMGGGSSDAATVLLALNQMWGLRWSLEKLMGIGLQLGADVPVFVRGVAAWADGVGEKLQAVSPIQSWYLVLIPAVSVSTQEVFSHPDLTRDTKRIKIRDFPGSSVRNDCEPVVRGLYPEIAQMLDWLGRYAPARLTGTGAGMFATFATQAEAGEVRARLPEGWKGFVAQGLNRSPTLEVVASLP